MSKITLGDRSLLDCLLDGGLNGRRFYDPSNKRAFFESPNGVYSVVNLKISQGGKLVMNVEGYKFEVSLNRHLRDKEVLEYEE